MKTCFITIILLSYCCTAAIADIRPSPMYANGISFYRATNIKMVKERVLVDLYPDSSVVHCTFYMRNEGKAENLNIDFPNMAYYFNHSPADLESKISVAENGIEVNKIDQYRSASDIKFTLNTEAEGKLPKEPHW